MTKLNLVGIVGGIGAAAVGLAIFAGCLWAFHALGIWHEAPVTRPPHFFADADEEPRLGR